MRNFALFSIIICYFGRKLGTIITHLTNNYTTFRRIFRRELWKIILF